MSTPRTKVDSKATQAGFFNINSSKAAEIDLKKDTLNQDGLMKIMSDQIKQIIKITCGSDVECSLEKAHSNSHKIIFNNYKKDENYRIYFYHLLAVGLQGMFCDPSIEENLNSEVNAESIVPACIYLEQSLKSLQEYLGNFLNAIKQQSTTSPRGLKI